MSEVKYFKLGPGQGMFWDPNQSKQENQKLVGNQVKQLDLTTNVETAKRNELIVPASEEEYNAYLAQLPKAGNVAPAGKSLSKEDVAKIRAEVKSELTLEFAKTIDQFTEMHNKTVAAHQAEIAELNKANEENIEALTKKHAAEIEALKAASAKK